MYCPGTVKLGYYPVQVAIEPDIFRFHGVTVLGFVISVLNK